MIIEKGGILRMAFGAEIIIRRQNKCIKFFEKNNANNLENALVDTEVLNNSTLNQRTIRNLVKEGVIICSNNKMYLDKRQLKIFKRSLKRFFLV